VFIPYIQRTVTPSSTPDWDIIGRYLAGESSPVEVATIRRWLEEHPEDARMMAALDGAARQAANPRLDVEDALQRVKSRAQSGARKAVFRFAAFAAVAAALLVAAVLMPRSRDGRVAAPLVFSTTVGQRDSLRLPDGSQVVLGPASRIEYRQGAGRTVNLSGQALFKVGHDPVRPFSVHAADVVIRDIGTEFSVHTDDASGPVRVVVHDGIVEVTAANTMTLNRGDVGVVTTVGVVRASRGAESSDDLAWTSGRLVFRNAPVAELVADLRRWYGVELRVTDSALLARHFTGSFQSEPVDRVLDVISLALGARVEQRRDTAILKAVPARR
jgi:transmembrane sensor